MRPRPPAIEIIGELVELGDDPEDVRAEPRPRVVIGRAAEPGRSPRFHPTTIGLTVAEAQGLGTWLYGKVKITIEPMED